MPREPHRLPDVLRKAEDRRVSLQMLRRAFEALDLVRFVEQLVDASKIERRALAASEPVAQLVDHAIAITIVAADQPAAQQRLPMLEAIELPDEFEPA